MRTNGEYSLRDIFYNLDYIEDKRAWMEDCIDQSYNVKCDELDCSKSFSRIMTTKTVPEILDIIDKAGFIHWVFIIRHPVIPLDGKIPYIEAGLRISEGYLGAIDYFIWIYIDIKRLDYFIEKYQMVWAEA